MGNVKSGLWLTLAIVTLFAGGMAWYFLAKHHSPDLKTLIPADAVVVLHSNNVAQTFDSINGPHFSEMMGSFPWGASLNKDLKAAASLFLKDPTLRQNFSEASGLLSLHIATGNDVGFCLMVQFKESAADLLKKWKSGQSEVPDFNKRIFEGEELMEWKDPESGRLLTVFFKGNTLIMSFKGYLVEDVIRILHGRAKSLATYAALSGTLRTISHDWGDVYVQVNRLPLSFKRMFLDSTFNARFNGMYNREASMLLDVHLSKGRIEFNGYLQFDDSLYFASALRGQGASPFALRPILPDDYEELRLWSLSDVKRYWERHTLLQERTGAASLKLRNQMERDGSLSLEEDMVPYLNGQFALGRLSTLPSEAPQHFLLLGLSARDTALTDWYAYAEERMENVFQGYHEGVKLRQWPSAAMPAALLGDVALDISSQGTLYFGVVDTCLILSPSQEALKRLISHYHTVSVLPGKKPLSEGTFSWELRPEGVMAYHKSDFMLPEDFDLTRSALQGLSKLAFSLSESKGLWFVKASLVTNGKSIVEMPISSTTTSTDGPKVTSFHCLSVSPQQKDLYAWGPGNNVMRLSTDLKVLWEHPLDGPLQGQPMIMDIDRNGSSDLAFFVNNRLQVFTRDGKALAAYYWSLSDTIHIEHTTVFDYDKTREYRIVVADPSGMVYFLTKEGKPVEGWFPKVSGSALHQAPAHLRIGTKDAILLHHENGTIGIYNRKGEVFKGYPYKQAEPDLSVWSSGLTGSTTSSMLGFLTKGGMWTKLNLEGKVVGQKQLVRAERDNRFFMAVSSSGRSRLVYRFGAGIAEMSAGDLNDWIKIDKTDALPDQIGLYELGNVAHTLIQYPKCIVLVNAKGNIVWSMDASLSQAVVVSEVNKPPRVYGIQNGALVSVLLDLNKNQ